MICVPRSGVWGQSLFVASIVVSWVYNIWLSREKADVEEAIFKEVLGEPRLHKFMFPNRTSAVAFLLLVSSNGPRDRKLWHQVLDKYLPRGPPVWEIWRDTITERLNRGESLKFDENHWNRSELTLEDDQKLLKGLFQDAMDAMEVYDAFKNPEAGSAPQ